MLNPKVLQEKKNELVVEIRAMTERIHDESRDFDGAESERWDELNRDHDVIARQLQTAMRIDAIDTEDDARLIGRGDTVLGRTRPSADGTAPAGRRRVDSRPSYEQRDDAVVGYFRSIAGLELEPWHVDGLAACGMKAGTSKFDIPLLNTRELKAFRAQGCVPQTRAAGQSTLATTGGEFIPEGFVSAVEVALLATSPLRRLCQIIRTATGNDLPWPSVDDTSIAGRLLAEETAVTETPVVVGSTVFNAYKYTSDMILATPELLQDEAIDLPALLGTLIGERIGRILNQNLTTGTGSSQPRGIVVAAQANNATLADASLTIGSDDVLDLVHTVDPAYRQSSALNWMCHDNVIGHIRKLVVTDVGYLWQPSLLLGDPDRLLGTPIWFNQDMASGVAPFVAGDEVLLYGDFNKYKIREVAGMRFRRLVERYADTDQEGFIGFLRADGNTVDNTTPLGVLTIIA